MRAVGHVSGDTPQSLGSSLSRVLRELSKEPASQAARELLTKG